MKVIGGEIDLKNKQLNEYFTDSGRSSIRLILNELKGKKFLVPNYLCDIILKIFDEYEIEYFFFSINDNLSINKNSILKQHYDVLYIINYFGQIYDYSDIVNIEKIIIEDNVFFPNFHNNHNYFNWIGFNSFRKISPLAEGSIIKSTLPLAASKINSDSSEFSEIKYKAKDMKYQFLNHHKYSEKEYLKLFKLAEDKLDGQTTINSISNYSLFRLFDFLSEIEREYSIRKKNFKVLYENLNDKAVRINTVYPSFFVITVERRDELRDFLFSKKIFCPIHWPKIDRISSEVYNRFLSIPVDSRYDEKDMLTFSGYINHFFEF